MIHHSLLKRKQRTGAIAVLVAIMLPAIVAMLALAIDCGNLLRNRANLQRAADAAALAGVRDLVPDSDGNQDLGTVRDAIREYADNNVKNIDGFTVLEDDIEVGRYDPDTIYGDLAILDSGIADTVRVTLRRDNSANSPVTLFFAGIFGIVDSDVSATATAVLQKASLVEPGAGVLPFTVPQSEWNAAALDDIWSIYGDGKLKADNGSTIPGNWGTCDIGNSNNSTADLRDQILNGLRQSDLDVLRGDGRIPQSTHIDASESCSLNGDPGLSSGMKSAVQAVHGMPKVIPLIDAVTGHGGNVEFNVVGWAVGEVVDSNWKGSKKSYVNIKKSFMYDRHLKPNPDLSVTEGVIEGAYTTPALVQ